jgi:hypothetical protein
MARAVLFDRQPFDRMVRCRTVAKVLSMGFVARDRDALLAFYDFPAEHWKHLRT